MAITDGMLDWGSSSPSPVLSGGNVIPGLPSDPISWAKLGSSFFGGAGSMMQPQTSSAHQTSTDIFNNSGWNVNFGSGDIDSRASDVGNGSTQGPGSTLLPSSPLSGAMGGIDLNIVLLIVGALVALSMWSKK